MAFQSSAEKHLFYENQTAYLNAEKKKLHGKCPIWFWNDRLVLVAHYNKCNWLEIESVKKEESIDEHGNDVELYCFTAIDLITNETRPIHFPSTGKKFFHVKVIPLGNNLGFFIESCGTDFCVNLVKLKWAPGEFQVIKQFIRNDRYPEILVDKLNPAKFVLKQWNGNSLIYQACKLVNGNIELGATYESPVNFNFENYSNDTLFEVCRGTIEIYDWTTKKQQTIMCGLLADWKINYDSIECVNGRIYMAVNLGKKYGIGYFDLETKHLKLLDFDVDERICNIQFFDGDLLVYAAKQTSYTPTTYAGGFEKAYCPEFKVYKIPVRNTQSLRKMVWSLVVQQLQFEESIIDPYLEAVKYLPFNSDLRSPWYSEETVSEFEEKTSEEHDFVKLIGGNTNSSHDLVNFLKDVKLN